MTTDPTSVAVADGDERDSVPSAQCRTCYGTGTVYNPDPYGLSGTYRACPACDGTGHCEHTSSARGVCDDCSALLTGRTAVA